MLQDLGFNDLPILVTVHLLRSFAPTYVSPSFNFQKVRCDDFVFYFDSHCFSAEKNSSLSLSSTVALYTFLALNAVKFFIAFGRVKRQPQAWWSPEVEETVSVRRKAFAAAFKSDEDCQGDISFSRHTSSIIAKAKAEV